MLRKGLAGFKLLVENLAKHAGRTEFAFQLRPCYLSLTIAVYADGLFMLAAIA
jgi:hypothetical protein